MQKEYPVESRALLGEELCSRPDLDSKYESCVRSGAGAMDGNLRLQVAIIQEPTGYNGPSIRELRTRDAWWRVRKEVLPRQRRCEEREVRRGSEASSR